MQYAILIYDEGTANPAAEPPSPEEYIQVMGDYNGYTQLLKDGGHYLGGEALQAIDTATTVRIKDGETVITDGPFAETKEALGGFYLIEAKDLDEALDLAAKCPGARFGTIEVRPVWDTSAAAADAAAAIGAAS